MAVRMERQNKELVAAFATAIFEARKRAGLSQEELADRADMSARFISFLETKRRQPTLSAFHALSVGLGLRMEDLAAIVEKHYGEGHDNRSG